MEFTSREIASALIFASFILLSIALSSNRKGILGSFLKLIRHCLNPKILYVFGAYLVYVYIIILIANNLGIWFGYLLKDTLIIMLFTGLPLIGKALKMKDSQSLFLHIWRQVFGLTAVLIVYVNLAPSSLLVELFLQLWIFMLLIVLAIAKHQKRSDSVVKTINALLTITGFILIFRTAVQIFPNLHQFDWEQQGYAQPHESYPSCFRGNLRWEYE